MGAPKRLGSPVGVLTRVVRLGRALPDAPKLRSRYPSWIVLPATKRTRALGVRVCRVAILELYVLILISFSSSVGPESSGQLC